MQTPFISSVFCLFLSTLVVEGYGIAYGRGIINQPSLSRSSAVTCEVVQSGVLDFMPWLEIHHIVVIRDELAKDGVYTIDFSPLNQTRLSTLGKMFMGQSVPGEIRVRHIPEKDVSLDEIKNNCMCADLSLSSLGDMVNPKAVSSWGVRTQLRHRASSLASSGINGVEVDAIPIALKAPDSNLNPIKRLSARDDDQYRVMHMVNNKKVADVILAVKNSWCTNMNLYLHNCQHFSYHSIKKIKQELNSS